MLEKLWKDIDLIYESQFRLLKKPGYVDDIIIMSQDNYYYIHQISKRIEIKIEKNYNLVRMWGGDIPYDITNYKIYVKRGDQIYTSENSMIELTYKIITPLLRDSKLKQIGV